MSGINQKAFILRLKNPQQFKLFKRPGPGPLSVKNQFWLAEQLSTFEF